MTHNCAAGAKKVYAVEATDMAKSAKRLVAAQGLEGTIEVIQVCGVGPGGQGAVLFVVLLHPGPAPGRPKGSGWRSSDAGRLKLKAQQQQQAETGLPALMPFGLLAGRD